MSQQKMHKTLIAILFISLMLFTANKFGETEVHAKTYYFTATISPGQVEVNQLDKYQMIITNTGESTLGTVNIAIPTGFTIQSPITFLNPQISWDYTVSSTSISLSATGGGSVISQGGNLSITFDANSPSFSSMANWTVDATTGIDGGGVMLVLQGEQPIVTIAFPQFTQPTIMASSTTINKDQTSLLTQLSSVSGGNPPYNYQWLKSFNGGVFSTIAGATGSEYTFSPIVSTSTGTWSFKLNVTDSSNVPQTITSNPINILVNSALVPPEVTVSPNVVSQNQTSNLSISMMTTGTSPYTYVWFQKTPGEDYMTVGENSTNYWFPGSTAVGTFTFFVQVRDSSGASVNSSTLDLTVTSAPVYTLTVIQSAHGTINPGTVSVDLGKDQSFTISADYGYYINDVLVDGISVGAITDYTFESVTASHSITAHFAANSGTYFIDVISTHGAPTSSAQVNEGENFSVLITSPETDTNQRWICTGYSIDGNPMVSGTSYTFSNVQADHTITFNWQAQYLVTFSQKGIDPNASGPIITVLGNTVTYEQLPFSVWINTGDSVTFSYLETFEISETGTQYILESSNSTSPLIINEPATIQGYYQSKIRPSGFAINTLAIVAISLIIFTSLITAVILRRRRKKKIRLITNEGGTISPSTMQTVDNGDDSTVFIIAADNGYKIADVVIDNTLHLGAVRTYKFTNVTDNHKISAIFEKE
jgi:hypothetical protein